MKRIIFAVVLVLVIASGLHAQGVTQISGTVQDQSGSSIPNAAVKVTQTDTGFMRETSTDQAGSYTLPNLPIGPYRLEATAAGFQTYVQTGIVLKVDVSPTINVAMQVGQVSQQVQVEAAALQVETTSTGVGQLIDNQSVLQLPLNGRNVTELVLLSGAATLCANCSGGFTGVRQYPVIGIQVAGGSPGGTYYSMDGSSHNDPGNNLNMAVPFPDALQEFKVETGAVPARYGQHANAVVTVATKSGTNAFHGDLFEFVRNADFNARNAFIAARDPLKRNQFGGTFGGPVLKNKLFFFAGYQRTIIRTNGTSAGSGQVTNDFIPTAAMLTGDFSGYASKACNPTAKLNANNLVQLTAPAGSPYQFDANDHINIAAFDPVALKYLSDFPVSPDPCGRYALQYPIPSTDDQILGRADYQINDKQSLFVRYFRAHFSQPFATANTPGNGLNAVSDFIDNLSAALVVGHTYVFSPRLINSFHWTFLDEPNDRIPAPYFSPTDAGSKMYSTPFGGPVTTLNVTNGFGLGGTAANTAIFNYRVFGTADDVDIIRGAHQISFGVQWLHQTELTHSTQFSNGVFTFSGQRTGLSLSDFMLGLMSQFQQGDDARINDYHTYLGLYVMDGWKFNRKLTLNYGLRWEPAFPISSSTNHVMTFSPTDFANNVKSTVYLNSPPGFKYPGDSGYPGQGLTPASFKIFSPRFGLIFDPRGQGREVIRASYGIFVDSQPIFDNIYVGSNPPWGALVTLSNVLLSDPYKISPTSNIFPFTLGPNTIFPAAGTFRVQQPHMNQDYTQQWNLSVEKQFGDWKVAVNYVGNKTTHAWSADDINAPVYNPAPGASTTGNEQARRPFNALNPTWGPFISQLIMFNTGGDAFYHGGLVTLQKAFTHNYSILANYTYSHCINDFDPHQNTQNSNLSPGNLLATRGNCGGDIRHLVNISGVVGSPKFNSHLLQAIAGDWQLSTIFKAETGYYTSITSGKDNAFTGISGQYADLVPGGNPIPSNQTPDAWFNTAAYTANAPGTIGNSGRNSMLGPGFWNINTALVRKFWVKETRGFEFRVEAFNLLNHTELQSPGAPGTTGNSLTSSDFGRVRSAYDPRILQLAGKFTF
jgi:hypothetical protein